MSEAKITPVASRGLAIILGLMALLLGGALFFDWGAVDQWSDAGRAWGWLVTAISFSLAIVLAQTGWRDRRSPSRLRLDWYLPAIKRLPPSTNPSGSILGRTFRRLLPGLQSNWQTKQRGLLRRWLRRLGPSWVASPLRRLSQATCLIVFCWLFFYVCWPYHAQPNLTNTLADVTFVAFDQDSQAATFQASFSTKSDETANNRDHSGNDWKAGATWFLTSKQAASGSSPEQNALGEFAVIDKSEDSVLLRPVGDLSPLFVDVITGMSLSKEFEATDRDPLAWPDHYTENLDTKEWIPAETFLMIDPLLSLSTAIASRSWVWSLSCAAAILIVCVCVPRGFCGYLCPLGTTIDLFDWAIAGRTKRWRVPDEGWWVHVKYYLLAGILLAASAGLLVSGFFAAIPVVTRGYLFLFDPLQSGATRGWHLVPSMNVGHIVSVVMFFAVLGLGFLRPRFWCKYVCPSGAVFSLGNLFRLTERKVESSCIHCNKCVEICPFDAIKPDFTTRVTDCTLCQSCAGVCPTHAIKFVERSNLVQLKVENDPPTHETSLGRRGFLSLATGSAASIAGAAGITVLGKGLGANLDDPDAFRPIRPPGSVPEQEFLEMCIRCGECFKACPNNVLQPLGFEQGLEGLWTPVVQADWAGCESSCNACGQVCPTGAIRALPLDEKRHARMGLAIVNETTCLPFAGKESCDLCVQECISAGYDAIEYTQVGVEVDAQGNPVDGTGFTAPVVLADKCVGCGLCQTRCVAINVKERGVLDHSAIIVETGEGREDRVMSGSYKAMHDERQSASLRIIESDTETETPAAEATIQMDDPFGTESEPSDDISPF
ncbi:4Fe-4S binding protein [Rhodopirellula halodulae]|uniref:4Fe-4S binding protein n=1 Tax=Rhodopirellula halodulae TaxID=2894198 RepID=UPI001E3DB24A|nr:4Fe-4S binding protein [Rhodopirellula sp. JC737]MCC9655024.1 4Fe-4S binding protein [Rhodopirellula sp. JC737]